MARRPSLTARRIRRFLDLPREDRRLFLTALGAVTLARLALWLAPFRTARAAMMWLARRPPGSPDAVPGRAVEIGWAVSSASRFVPAASCLPQALACEVMLRRQGHPAELRFGVARDASGAVEAHAWVGSGGRVVVGEHELERYTVLLGGTGRPAPVSEGRPPA